jgi:hypothetical protein
MEPNKPALLRKSQITEREEMCTVNHAHPNE